MTTSAIVLLSGGLDSTLCFLHAIEHNENVLAITMNYGQNAAEKELETAKTIAMAYQAEHKVIEFPLLNAEDDHAFAKATQNLPQFQIDELDDQTKTKDSAKSVWVPNRNGVFINLAASVAEKGNYQTIYVGFNKEEASTFPDNSAAFLEAINSSLKFSTMADITVTSPTLNMNKIQIVEEMQKRQFDWKLLWSCYSDEEKMCGSCESCQRLKRALHENGLQSTANDIFLRN